MGCFGETKVQNGADGKKREQFTEGVLEKRKCRDVLFLVLYLAFLGFTAYNGAVAFREGNLALLLYGTDSYGNVCGSDNGPAGPDLRDQKKTYYLNPLASYQSGYGTGSHRVCVSECPTQEHVCSESELPCTNRDKYVCYYYRHTLLYNTGPAVSDFGTGYYEELAHSNVASCVDAASAVLAWDSGGHLNGLSEAWTRPLRDPLKSAGKCGELYQGLSQIPELGPCFPIIYQTTDVLNRCVPTMPTNATSVGPAALSALPGLNIQAAMSVAGYANRKLQDAWNSEQLRIYMSDLVRSWLIVLVAGVIGGALFSILWMVVLRFFASFVAWATVLATILVFAALALFCYLKMGIIEEDDVSIVIPEYLPDQFDDSYVDKQVWEMGAYILSGFTGLLILLSLLMVKRMRVVSACMRTASQVMSTMPSMIIFPLVPLMMQVAFTVWWLVVVAYMWTVGENEEITFTVSSSDPISWWIAEWVYDMPCHRDALCRYELKWDTEMRYMMVAHLFSLFWTFQVISGIGCVTIAGATATFYWCAGEVQNLPRAPMWNAIKRTFNYHLGSIALGAFFMAVFQFVRAILEFFHHRFQSVTSKNSFLRYVMQCLRCCLWHVEKVLKITNRAAYAIVGTKGHSFCTSAGQAARILVQNAVTVASVTLVGGYVVWFGKLFIAAASGIAAYSITNMDPYTDPSSQSYLSSPIMPVGLSALVSYAIAVVFFQAYDMVLDTLILCYCEDRDTNAVEDMKAPPLLMAAMGHKAQGK